VLPSKGVHSTEIFLTTAINHDSKLLILPPNLPSHGTQTWRQIRRPRSPPTLLRPQHQRQHASIQEKPMIDPILRINFSIQRRALDIDILVRRIKVFVADGGGFACLPVFDADFGEEGWGNEVDVLAGVGEETDHCEGNEGAHSWVDLVISISLILSGFTLKIQIGEIECEKILTTAVIISRYTNQGIIKLRRDVKVGALSRQSRPPAVVILVDRQESLFVTNVE